MRTSTKSLLLSFGFLAVATLEFILENPRVMIIMTVLFLFFGLLAFRLRFNGT